MTVAFTAETTINKPMAEVWDTLVDWDRAGEWMNGVEWIRADGETAVGTGLTFRSRSKDRPSEIAELEPGRSITLRSQQGGVTADYRYRLTPAADAATTVNLVADCRTSGVWTLMGPVLRSAIRRTDSDQLDAFRRLLEASN